MDVASSDDTDETACAKLVDALRLLNQDLSVPRPSDLNHRADDTMFALMAEQAIASGSPGNNPRIPTAEDIISLYRDMW